MVKQSGLIYKVHVTFPIMDGTINDFFNEIDQIAPPKESKSESAWQECYDNGSGYSYYWNVKTDEVTWEIPEEYKLWKEQNITHKSGHLYVPPKASPLFPSTTLSSTKIYKIQNDSQNLSSNSSRKTIGQSYKRSIPSDHNKDIKKLQADSHNATEEKIVLISSYGADSEESDPETEKHTESVPPNKNQPIVSTVASPPNETTEQLNSNSNSQSGSDNEEDDIDLLTQIQNRAKVLKDLGGELPPAVKKLVEKKEPDAKNEPPYEKSIKKEKRNVTGFSLLASYGDSDEEEIQATIVPSITENKMAHSTLFPISKAIDIAQFSEEVKELKSTESPNLVDSRAFHRKRRINIDFTNKKAKTEPDINHSLNEVGSERQGLGFKKELDGDQNVDVPKTKNKADYPGFQSGGLMFVKSDPLLPITVELEKKEMQIQEDTDKSKTETMQTIEETRKTLNEKLNFLCEGREAASPVQVMIIQMETLYEAVKVGSLTMSYLHKWLKETCSELVKLEKDAAPSGWLLQWDRINKRYYYRNQQTGDSQWEYPQPDIVGGDEAMDISTTPPPPVEDVLVPVEPVTSTTSTIFPIQPPPPPRIKSPTPPPPPKISKNGNKKKKGKSNNPPLPTEILPHMPAPPLPQENLNPHGEPLPPGVESSEITSYKSASPPPLLAVENKLPPQANANDALGSAINSFYSDLAALENQTTTTTAPDVVPVLAVVPVAPPPPPPPVLLPESVTSTNIGDDAVTKKKRKTKVKLVQGLAMKKKGVSKLVERWKSVQKDY